MIFFFYGPNLYAAQAELERMTSAYLKKAGSDFGLERLEGNASWEQLQGALLATPFLANSRLVIISDFGKAKPDPDRLAKLIEGMPSTTVAVFYDREADRRTGYFKTLCNLARAVEFKLLTTPELVQWIGREVKRQGGSITRSVAQQLLEVAGEDQWRLSGEIAKLVAYQPEVTKETIAELVVPNLNQSVFDLVDAMTAGRGKAALTAYHALLAERTNELYLLTMIIWQLRNLLTAKSAAGMAAAELASKTGLSPYVANKSIAAAQPYRESTLKKAFLAAVECEYNIKSGRQPAAPAVENLIVAVARSAA